MNRVPATISMYVPNRKLSRGSNDRAPYTKRTRTAGEAIGVGAVVVTGLRQRPASRQDMLHVRGVLEVASKGEGRAQGEVGQCSNQHGQCQGERQKRTSRLRNRSFRPAATIFGYS